MTDFELQKIELELKKRTRYHYHWNRKQNDIWDEKTNFIYQIKEFDKLLTKIKFVYDQLNGKIFKRQEFYNYAANRWYNFWSATAIESIFCSQKDILPHQNAKDKLVDFTIKGISFDHKTSVFPKGFGKSLRYSVSHKSELINWLYQNQSQQNRKHLENRIFLVVYDSLGGKHWKLKAEIKWLKKIILGYLHTFRKESLVKLHLNKKPVFSDIIWAIKR